MENEFNEIEIVTEVAPETEEKKLSKPTDLKKTFNLVGMIDGVLSIIFGLVVFGSSIGSMEIDHSYGGDAYTGMQNASAQAANNIYELSGMIKTGLAGLLIVVGIALVCYFGAKYFGGNNNESK